MKITTISVSYQRKFNLGNYNSVDLGCSLWAQIDVEEDEDTCIHILQDKCREHVRNEYQKAKNGSAPAELIRVNIPLEEEEEEDGYGSHGEIERNFLLDVGDK